jgi:hypothetical protein
MKISTNTHNPLYYGALTKNDVRSGELFIVIVCNFGIVEFGKFIGRPYCNSKDQTDTVAVRIESSRSKFKDKQYTIYLAGCGIIPYDDTWPETVFTINGTYNGRVQFLDWLNSKCCSVSAKTIILKWFEEHYPEDNVQYFT